MKSHSLVRTGELLISLGLLALCAYIIIDSQTIAQTQRYEQLGPRLFPMLIGFGLGVFGAVLGWHALTGGWRNLPEQEEHKNPDWLAFLWVSAAIVLQMALIKWIGFVLASTLLFVLVARGFGSRRLVRDAGFGLAISLTAYLLFTQALKLNLPAGPLKFLGI